MAIPPSGKRHSASDTPKPQSKRRRVDNINDNRVLASLDRAVSPPPLRRGPSLIALQAPEIDETNGDIFVRAYLKDKQNKAIEDVDTIDLTGKERVLFSGSMTKAHCDGEQKQEEERLKPKTREKKGSNRFVTGHDGQTKRFPSPFQLTWIRDLPDSDNVDTIRIHDILGDVMIKEAWIFNFRIDVDWVMDQFDPDIKDIVDVKIVHGSWRKEDGNRNRLEEQANRYPNAKIISAYMPEPFGTHHTKMIILFRHDELAQVIIHTSNMIEFDWTNMTQAVWRSPLLPLVSIQNSSDASALKPRPIGESFKNDLLAYLRAYGKSRVGGLYDNLGKYSFNEVRAVFVASVPGKYQLNDRGAGKRWGWMGLERALSNIPLSNQHDKDGDKGRIVLQVSSIATLGSMDTWLSPVLYKALSAARNTAMTPSDSILAKKPKLSIIFPTVKEVRNSLNGYASGQAIHIRIQTKPQESQLGYLRPFLCHWNPSSDSSFVQSHSPTNQINSTHSGRTRAAPHIKTYIRFTDQTCKNIEWAMLSSANLSTQAWGTALKNPSGGFLGPGQGEVKISSYEVGVLIYPELFEDSNEERVEIIPVFRKDTPDVSINNSKDAKVIGLRMPYDLPIRPYGKDDVPWCGSMSYAELDWRGRSWEV